MQKIAGSYISLRGLPHPTFTSFMGFYEFIAPKPFPFEKERQSNSQIWHPLLSPQMFFDALSEFSFLFLKCPFPGLCGVDWVPAFEPKVTDLIPCQGTFLGEGQVSSRWCSRGNHTLIFLFLSFSLPFPL